MIHDPLGIISVLLVIEAAILFAADHPRTRRFFKIIPSMFWIYFIPLLATTFGILPQKAPVYKFISSTFLPACLVLLLLSVHIKAILKLGKTAILMMLAGSAGIVIGGPIVFLIFKQWLPEGMWAGFGALSASWIGGSANMIAVKEAIRTPDNIFVPMVVVDTIVAYSWMGIVIALAGYQAVYDKWNRSKTGMIEELNRKISEYHSKEDKPISLKAAAAIFAVALSGGYIALKIAELLPEIKQVISTYTWTIIIVTVIGISLSFTKVKNLEARGASRIGYGMLYFVLASIGARANLTDLASAPILLLAGFLWVAIHALFLFVASRLLKAPLFLAATASQANIGGPVSAPVVAAVYQPDLAPVGLLLAIVGNIIGLYLGILTGHLCRFVSLL